MTRRRRLDTELVRRGLAPSRGRARELVDAGLVTVGGAPATKAARLVADDEPLRVLDAGPRFVSRAGGKLEAALDRFGIEVAGRRALDAGASTGGFTDCLLQRGAAHVVAVDVGRAQLHQKLIDDDRVDGRERTDIRSVTAADLGGPWPVVVADLSFIGLSSVLEHLLALTTTDGDLLVLVKPQFEAGRAEADRGRGVIRDPEVWHRVLLDVASRASALGAAMMDLMVAAVRGAHGNVEFVAHLRRPGDDPGEVPDVERLVGRAVADAVEATEVTPWP